MADPNEAGHESSEPQPPTAEQRAATEHPNIAEQRAAPAPQRPVGSDGGTGDTEVAEVVEAEFVDAPEQQPRAEPTGTLAPYDTGPAPSVPAEPEPHDAEQHRQYQEFLQFQQFQQFQRWQAEQERTGGTGATGQPGNLTPTAPGGAPARTRRSPWRTALWPLRFKLVRRLLYLLLALLLLPSLVQHFFTGSSGSSGSGSTGGGVPPDSVPITAPNPDRAVKGVYNYLRGQQPERTCSMFDENGRAAFALEHGAETCADATNQLHGKITAGGEYANPSFAENAVETAGPEAVVYGCRVNSTGGPELGSFGLTRGDDGGWIISSYDRNSPTCQ